MHVPAPQAETSTIADGDVDGLIDLDSDGTCNLDADGDLPSTDPLLADLADYGGATRTHALKEGSPAIDAGSNDAGPDVDQRGKARPNGIAKDIGAFEFVPADRITPGANAPCGSGIGGVAMILPIGLFSMAGGGIRRRR